MIDRQERMRSEVLDFKMYPTTSNSLEVTDLRGNLGKQMNCIAYLIPSLTS